MNLWPAYSTFVFLTEQASFYSMQISFRFHSQRCFEILASPSICTKIRTRWFHRTEEVSNIFSVSRHIIHISMTISAESGTRYQPQFYKDGMLPSPPTHTVSELYFLHINLTNRHLLQKARDGDEVK